MQVIFDGRNEREQIFLKLQANELLATHVAHSLGSAWIRWAWLSYAPRNQGKRLQSSHVSCTDCVRKSIQRRSATESANADRKELEVMFMVPSSSFIALLSMSA